MFKLQIAGSLHIFYNYIYKNIRMQCIIPKTHTYVCSHILVYIYATQILVSMHNKRSWQFKWDAFQIPNKIFKEISRRIASQLLVYDM